MKNFTQFFKSFFTLVVILLLGVGNVWGAQDWARGVNPTSGGTFFIYNPSTQKFLNDNNGTLAAEDVPNTLWIMPAAGSSNNGVYTVGMRGKDKFFNLDKVNNSTSKPSLKDGWQTFQISIAEENNADYGVMCYIRRTASPTGYMSSDPTTNAISTPNDGCKWIFLSSTVEVSDANFHGISNGWSANSDAQNANYLNGSNGAEVFNKTFDIHQTISNVVPGIYCIEVKGFYRRGTKNQVINTDTPIMSYLYAQIGDAETQSVSLKSIKEGEQSKKKNVGDEFEWSTGFLGGTKHCIPDNTVAADKYIHDHPDKYTSILYVSVLEKTDLLVGLKCENNISDAWTYFDDFKITYIPYPIFYYQATAVSNDIEKGDAFVSFANYNSATTATTDVCSEMNTTNVSILQSLNHPIYYKAAPRQGYNFEGWYANAAASADINNRISGDTEYKVENFEATSTDINNPSSYSLYAKFVEIYTPTFAINDGFDRLLVEQNATLLEMFTTHYTPNLVYTLKDNDSVLEIANGTTLKALKSGTAKIVLSQEAIPGNNNGGRAEFEITVSKHDVIWSWNAGGAAYLFNTTINNILTLTEGNPSNISIVSDNELVAKVENGNLVIGKVAGTAQITVTAATDNKWNAKEEIFTVTPGYVANHVPFTIDSEEKYNIFFYAKSSNNDKWTVGTGGDAWRTGIRLGADNALNSDDKYVDLHFVGTPDKMSFQTSLTGTATGIDYRIYESEDGKNWGNETKKWTDRNLNVTDLQLKPTTRYVRLFYSGNYCAYFKNVSISELKTLSAETPEAIETTLGDTESVSTNIVLTYANAGITINASVAGEGFSINKASVEGGIDVYGEETFVVSFDPTGKAAGEHSATITFTDGTLQKEVVVTAHVLVPLSLVAMNNENGTDYYYATFSNADYAVEFGEDVEVYTVSVDGDRMTLDPVSNNQVPANNGVLIKSLSNNILYKYISSAADLSNNMLQPGTGDMTEGDNCRFYRLAYYDYAAKTGLGFYYGSGCKDGEAFKCKAGTAYLAVPKDMVSGNAPARFLLGRQDVSTELLNVNINDNQGKKVMMNGVLYIIRDGKTYDSFGRMVK